jgi:hypothetical protein
MRKMTIKSYQDLPPRPDKSNGVMNIDRVLPIAIHSTKWNPVAAWNGSQPPAPAPGTKTDAATKRRENSSDFIWLGLALTAISFLLELSGFPIFSGIVLFFIALPCFVIGLILKAGAGPRPYRPYTPSTPDCPKCGWRSSYNSWGPRNGDIQNHLTTHLLEEDKK